MGVAFESLCCTDSLLDYLKSVIGCRLVCNNGLLLELLLNYGVFKFLRQKMRIDVYMSLTSRKASNSATVSSDNGSNF